MDNTLNYIEPAVMLSCMFYAMWQIYSSGATIVSDGITEDEQLALILLEVERLINVYEIEECQLKEIEWYDKRLISYVHSTATYQAIL